MLRKMVRFKIALLILHLICHHGSAESDPNGTTILHKSFPYPQTASTEAPSFLARIANWLLPFGASDQTAAAGEQNNQYLPPPQANYYQDDCNSCNKEPWIPVATHFSQNTVVDFVPPNSGSSSYYQQPPSSQSFNSFEQLRPPAPVHYAAPPKGNGAQFRPRQPSKHYGLPKPQPVQYRPPSPTLSDYVAPPPVNFRRPNLNQYGPPQRPRPKPQKNNLYYQSLHPPPLGNHYGAPAAPGHQYGAPAAPVNQYRPPSIPVNQYGPPSSPGNQYGPPSSTHLKPISNYDSYPPLNVDLPIYNLSPTLATLQQHGLPPAVPSDSYGMPVTGANAHYPPAAEQLPLSSETGPIPIPNLSSFPVLPIRPNSNFRNEEQIQIIPSLQVANYISSIEHPINVIQSPLVELDVKEEESKSVSHTESPSVRLSENPIVVEDTFTAASNINSTYTEEKAEENHQDHMNLLQKLLLEQGILGNPDTKILDIKKVKTPTGENKTAFQHPAMDYSNWVPYRSLGGEMLPPPAAPSTWLTPVDKTTTKKPPKRIQIIVPYVTSKPPGGFNRPKQSPKGAYTTLVPVYMPPLSTDESLWSKFMDDFKITEAKAVAASGFKTPSTTMVNNIQDLLTGDNKHNANGENQLPYDIIRLQKTIDHWTQQEFSNKQTNDTVSNVKNIPNDFFSTTPPPSIVYHASGSNTKEIVVPKEIESNLISEPAPTTTTTEKTTTTVAEPEKERKIHKSLWEEAQVTVSPVTKEKLYVVTPQTHPQFDGVTAATAWSAAPKIEHGKLNDATFSSKKFSIRVEPENKESRTKLKKDQRGAVKIVYSEWPHLINNLKTTTTPLPTTRHPLFGLMAFPSNSSTSVETFVGHSKVVDAPSAVKKPS